LLLYCPFHISKSWSCDTDIIIQCRDESVFLYQWISSFFLRKMFWLNCIIVLIFVLFLLLQLSLWSIDIPECKFTYEIKTFVFLAIYDFCPSFLVSIIFCWNLTSFLWLITGAASPTPLEEMGLVHRKSDVDLPNSSDGSRPGSADSGSRKGILRPSSRSSTPEPKRIRSRSNSGTYI
jgi:hypothetical protein